MNKFLIFIVGMFAGALLLYSILYVINIKAQGSEKEQLRRQMIETISRNLKDLNKEPEVQYIEIRGRKGNVTLHTGMPKDSVQILVGKPDEVDLDELGHTYYEKWGYKLKNDYFSDLDIDFENGKLKAVRQN